MKMSRQSRDKVSGKYVTRCTEDDKDEIYQCLVEDLLDFFLHGKHWAIKSIELGEDEDGDVAIIVNLDDNIRNVYTLDWR